ncbi:hypothetical protein ABIA69_001813 [Lysinibacillus parviboronicapiens]|uniref:Uncharacterized protein n=1 Tax=Lysinibacillus parviboronicapiens TaxID=436516 RepID=A0ABV2PI95_9BACI
MDKLPDQGRERPAQEPREQLSGKERTLIKLRISLNEPGADPSSSRPQKKE